MFDCYVGLLQGGAFLVLTCINSFEIEFLMHRLFISRCITPIYHFISLFKWLNGQINELVVSKWQSSANRGENEPLLPFPMNRAKALTGSASPLGLGLATWEHRGKNKAKMLEIHFPADSVDMTILFCRPCFVVRFCCYPSSDESHDANWNLRGFYRRFPAVTWPAWKVKQEWMIRILRHAFADPPLSTKKAAWNTAARDLSLFGRKTCTICKSLRYQISPHISYTWMNLHSFCCLELIPTEANQPSTGPKKGQGGGAKPLQAWLRDRTCRHKFLSHRSYELWLPPHSPGPKHHYKSWQPLFVGTRFKTKVHFSLQ